MSKERFQKAKQLVRASRFAIESNLSLFVDVPSNPSVRRKILFDDLARYPAVEPLNREEDLRDKFLAVLNRRQIVSPLEKRNPYWMPDIPYNLMDVVGTCAQFADQHGAPLPKTTLPPVGDLEKFIDRVLSEPSIVTVDRQFDILLDITDNNVIGAANLGMLATRYISRFADQRAYPSVGIGGSMYTEAASDDEIGEVIRKWNAKIARFETNNPDQSDGIGDGYYFWTHMFAALALSGDKLRAKTLQHFFEQGTEMMIFVKYKIAKRKGDILPHAEASKLGRSIGLLLSDLDK